MMRSNHAFRRRCAQMLSEAFEPRRLFANDPASIWWNFSAPNVPPTLMYDAGGQYPHYDVEDRFRVVNLTNNTPTNDLVAKSYDENEVVTYGAQTGMPADGNYELKIDFDADPTPSDFTGEEFFLNGDANHDRVVNFDDLTPISQNFNGVDKSFAQGDFTGDGIVNFDDQVILSQRYNTRLSAVPIYAGQVTVDSLGETWDGKTPLRVNWAPISDATLQGADPDNANLRISGYDVYRSTNSVDFTKIGTTERDLWSDDPEPSVYSYYDATPSDALKYWYRIRPFYETTDNNDATVAHHLPTTNKAWRIAAIKAPEHVTISSRPNQAVRVNWTDASANETGYKVEVRKVGGSWLTVGTTAANAHTLTISHATLAPLGSGTPDGGLTTYYEARVTALSSTTQIDSAPVQTSTDAAVGPANPAYNWIFATALDNVAVGETKMLHFAMGPDYANHEFAFRGGIHATFTPATFRLDSDGAYDLSYTGTKEGSDGILTKDTTADLQSWWSVNVLANDINVTGGGALVEADSTEKTITISRDGETTSTSPAIHIDISLINGPENASEDDVDVPTTAEIPAGQQSTTIQIKSKDDEKAEGLESIWLKLKPANGAEVTQGAGTIDDDVTVSKAKAVFLSNFRKVVGKNGFDFAVTFMLEGEHLDRVESGQLIKSSETRLHTELPGSQFTRLDLANEYHFLDTDALAFRQIDTDGEYTDDVVYEQNGSVHKWQAEKVTPKDGSKNGRADCGVDLHRSVATTWVETSVDGTPTVTFVRDVTRDMKTKFFETGTFNAPLNEIDWGYEWDNSELTVGPPEGYPEIVASYNKLANNQMITGYGVEGGFNLPFQSTV